MWLLLGCPPQPNDGVPSETEPIESPAPEDTALPEVDPEDAGDAPELVTLSHDSALLTQPITLTAESDVDGIELLYSLDGRDPVDAWPGSLEVSETTVLRLAVNVGPHELTEVARTFIFPDTLGDQAAPTDYPTQWWVEDDEGPFPADYVMDPTVLEDFGAYFPEAFSAIPTLSVILPPEDLFSTETGIHENARESGVDWERAAFVELLNAEDANFNVPCALRVHGRSSRRPERSTKKGFRVLFKSDYGPGKLKTQLFPDNDVDVYDGFVLRGRYNRSWAHYQAPQRERSMYVRERFGMELLAAMGQPSSATRHVHLYLNGLYWGLYLMEERPDAHYHANRTDTEVEDWDVLNSGTAQDGDLQHWNELLEMARAGLEDDDAWQAFTAEIDLTNFVDLMLLQLYTGNIDFPESNWYAARPRDKSRGWQFFLWDAELTFVNTGDDLIDTMNDEDSPGELFQAARSNATFREAFNERAHLHLDEGGELHPAQIIPRWSAIAEEVKPYVSAESARWGDHWRDDRGDPDGQRYSLDHWEEENERITTFYLVKRHSKFIQHLIDADLYLE